MRQEKQIFSEQWASVWPIEHYVIFGLSFRYRSGYRFWDTWLDQKDLRNNDSGKPCLKNAALNEAWGCRGKRKAQTKRNREKERNLERPHYSCCKTKPCSFLSPAWRVVTSKSWGKRLIHGRTVLEFYSACSANSSINRPSPHNNARHQVPPVQKRILPFAYLSNRWWMLLNAYIKRRTTCTVRQSMTDNQDQT